MELQSGLVYLLFIFLRHSLTPELRLALNSWQSLSFLNARTRDINHYAQVVTPFLFCPLDLDQQYSPVQRSVTQKLCSCPKLKCMLVTRSRTVQRLQVTSVERFLALSYLSVGPQPQVKATVRIHFRHIGPGKKQAQTRILGQVA